MKLTSNRELHDYLLALSTKLTSRGDQKLSRVVTAARRHAAGMSTEFLGESRIALRQVAKGKLGILDEEELAEVLEILNQLDSAFDER